MSERLKILISAYACSPIRGSEPGMGWGFVKAISEHHDLWVITEEEKFKSEIEAELERQPKLKEQVKFYYIPKVRHKTLRKIWPPSYYWFYKTWQKKAYELASQLHEEIQFDIVHQLNMVGFREPGYLWKLDVPFVWGPIGGMDILPWRFIHKLGTYGFFYHLGKNCYNLAQMKLMHRPRLAASKAKVLIAATPDTQTAIKKLWNKDSEVICEIGPPENILNEHSIRKTDEPLRLVWCGLHVPRKALNLLLESLTLVSPDVDWHLDIIGQGSRTKAWQNLAAKLNITDQCSFHGWVSRQESVSIMKKGHVFNITSLADLTSTVTLEAISQGLPVICLDHCGFSHVVTKDCGIKISIVSPKQVQKDIAIAIQQIYYNEPLRYGLAENAVKRAGDFSWDKKSKLLNSIYEDSVNST